MPSRVHCLGKNVTFVFLVLTSYGCDQISISLSDFIRISRWLRKTRAGTSTAVHVLYNQTPQCFNNFYSDRFPFSARYLCKKDKDVFGYFRLETIKM